MHRSSRRNGAAIDRMWSARIKLEHVSAGGDSPNRPVRPRGFHAPPVVCQRSLRKALECNSDRPLYPVSTPFNSGAVTLGDFISFHHSFQTDMALLLPNKIMHTHSAAAAQDPADPSPLPLALVKKTPLRPSLIARAQFASCASMTKSFLAKAFPSPHRKLWGFQSSPTGVDDPTEASIPSEEQDDEAARGEICEIIVVAIQKVTDSGPSESEEQDRVSAIGPGRLHRSSIWGSAKWSQGQLQPPHRIACTVRSGATTKVSAQPKRCDDEFVFDEKFVFERRENDAQYHEVTIEVSSVAPGFGKKHRLGQVAVDLDAAFAAQAAGPIHRQSALTTADGSASGVEIHYVLHRLVVKNATAAAASRVLTRSSTSLNDDDDMDACGQIFPDLWYLC
ncbi:unnamed protein product [Phytophthora lilii]|uniref:Unnamed protein product n=1 Tax=Phytophthora lilii TaxID=2077276 RepID=A0A9W6TC81_9STRA|nr:unnamed protein product [Phytophthora lilii]